MGREFRENIDQDVWSEFGGKADSNETLGMTAQRETFEETAGTLNISLAALNNAEAEGHHVDFFNPKSGVFYRMYCIKVPGPKPDPEIFKTNAIGKQQVEKVEWAYFKATDVIFNKEGRLPNEYAGLYSTFCIRLGLLREKDFLNDFIGC